MQAWGERAHWSIRDTASEPTKSGVVGLLACALGWKEDEELRSLSQKIRIGIRCDKPGVRLVDFHTVGGGFDEPMLLSADGKPKYIPSSKKPHIEPGQRAYLCDASFLVAIQSDEATIARLSEAILNPVWPYYLGRKSCPPSLPVFVDMADFGSLEDALKYNQPKQPVRVVIECCSSETNAVRRRDEIDSHSCRTYFPRYVVENLWQDSNTLPEVP
jgi:CRISPR system Cascade subunit CasD